jgi:hypothetical protein
MIDLKPLSACQVSSFIEEKQTNNEADEKCALLGHYTTSSGNFLPTFRDKPSVPS